MTTRCRRALRFPFVESLRGTAGFDVADCAAYFDNHHVDVVLFRHATDCVLDLIGDVGNYLNGLPEVIATPLFFVTDR